MLGPFSQTTWFQQKTSGASQQMEIVRNKDGSIRKASGRKAKANKQVPATVRIGVMERVRQCRTAGGIGLEADVGVASRMDIRQLQITEEHMEEGNGDFHVGKAEADVRMENVILRSQVEALQTQLRTKSHPVISSTTSTQHRPELHTLVEPIQHNSSLISL